MHYKFENTKLRFLVLHVELTISSRSTIIINKLCHTNFPPKSFVTPHKWPKTSVTRSKCQFSNRRQKYLYYGSYYDWQFLNIFHTTFYSVIFILFFPITAHNWTICVSNTFYFATYRLRTTRLEIISIYSTDFYLRPQLKNLLFV